MKSYVGLRGPVDCKILIVESDTDRRINTVDLPLYSEIRDHSNSFEWGYTGSGPSQTSVALLADNQELLNTNLIHLYVPEFTKRIIALLPTGNSPCQDWEMSNRVVLEFVRAFENGFESARDWSLFRASITERELLKCSGKFFI